MANDSVLEKKSDGTTVPSPPIITRQPFEKHRRRVMNLTDK